VYENMPHDTCAAYAKLRRERHQVADSGAIKIDIIIIMIVHTSGVIIEDITGSFVDSLPCAWSL